MCERLACSDDQRARIDAIRVAHRDDMVEDRAEVKRLRAAMQAEQAKPSPDAEALARLRAELDTAKTELRKERSDAKAEIATVLTPAQREQLARFEAHRARKAEHGGKAKAHAERDGKGKGKAERDGKGEAHAERRKGKGKAERDGRGEAHAKRGGKRRPAARAG